MAANPPSNPEPCVIDSNEQNLGIETGKIADLSNESAALLPGKQDVDAKRTGTLDNAELLRQEQAAAKVQAAFRGYLVIFFCIKLYSLMENHLFRIL